MNRNYKVIWNASLNCFMAVSEYAKARGKSSKSSVSSNATINTTSNLSSTNAFRLTAIGLGLIAAGLTMSPQAFAATGVGGAVATGVTNCAPNASVGKTDSLAVGCDSVADLSSDPAVNFYQRGNPDNLAIDTSTAFNSTAVGTGARATEAGTSLGMNASSSNLGVALGIQSKSQNVAAVAIGPAALATGNTSLALGRQSAATADFAQAIGNVASATGKGSLAMGHSARAEGYRSIAIGSADIDGADATGTQSGVVYQTNQQTLAKGLDSIAIGSGAIADATFGFGASGMASTAIGKTAKAQGPNTLALGANSDAKNGTAVGSGAIVRNGGLAVGMHADAGPGIGFVPTSNVALGDDSKVTGGGFNVALGALAVAGDSDLSAQAYRPITGIAVAGENAVGEVSIGGDSSGQYTGGSVYRRITNLAAGAADTDGVNVSQLKYLADIVGSGQTHFYSVNSTDTAAGNYNNDGATGTNSMAAGINAEAKSKGGMAMGVGAKATGPGGVVDSAANNIAIGTEAEASATAATAIGKGAKATHMDSVSIGRDAEATAQQTLALGYMAKAQGQGSTAFGMAAKATGTQSIALGATANASALNAAAIGRQSVASAESALALGHLAQADGKFSLAAGKGAIATGDYSIAQGNSAKATDEHAIAIGGVTYAKKEAISIGGTSRADGEGGIAIGHGARVAISAAGSMAIGKGAISAGKRQTNIGELAGVGVGSGVGVTLIGYKAGNSITGASEDTSVGSQSMISAKSTGGNAALGSNAGYFMEGGQNTIVGNSAGQTSKGSQNAFMGHDAGKNVIGSHNVAMGKSANAGVTVNRSVTLGSNSKVTIDGGVALGESSIADGTTLGVLAFQPLDSNGNPIAIVAPTAVSEVSVGSVGLERRVTNVAAGGADTDAVNVSQLRGLSNTVAANKTKYYSVNSTGGTNDLNEGATGQNAMAMGRNSVASGSQAISIGSSSAGGQKTTASGEQSIAIGANSVSKGSSSIAIGGDDLDAASKANLDGTTNGTINGGSVNTTFKAYTGRDLVETPPYQVNTESGGAASIAIGAKSLSKGDLSTAIGVHSNSSGTASSAFGVAASATEEGSVALGAGSIADKDGATATGANSRAQGNSSTAIGVNAEASGERSVALGEGAQATTLTGTAIGSRTRATGIQSTAVGVGSKATKQWATAMGFVSEANGVSSVALGDRSVVDGKESIAIGKGNTVSGKNSIAVGTGHTIGGDNSGAFGDPNIVNGNNSYAVGNNNTIDADNSFVLGNNVTINASDKHSIALGEGAIINGEDSIAIGRNASAAAGTRNGLAIGVRSKSGNHAVSLGDDATSGNYAVALGSKAKTQIGGTAIGQASSAVSNATALGRGAIAGQSGNVALGNQSITAAQHTGAFAINNLPVAGLTSGARTVSVGVIGAERQIQNVAPGVVDANSTDAINGSQLFGTNSVLKDLGDTVDDGLNFDGDTGATVNRKLGQKLTVKGGATTPLSDNNIGVVASSPDTLTVKLAKNIDLGKTGSVKMGTSAPFGLGPVTTVDRLGVTTGNIAGSASVTGLGVVVNGPFGIPSTTLTTNGLNIIGGPSVTRSGIDAGGKVISNVKDGVAPKEGVNVSQLVTSVAGSRTEVTKGTNVASVGKTTGGSGQDVYTVNADGASVSAASSGAVSVTPSTKNPITNVTDYEVDLSQATKDSISDNTTNITKGIKFNVNNGLKKTFALGEEIKFDTDSNLTTAALSTGDGIKLALAPVVNVGTANPVQINGNTGEISGLTNRAFDPTTTYTGGIAATQEQLSDLNGKVTTLGFGIKAADGNTVQKNLGEAVEIVGSNSNITTQVNGGKVEVALNNNLDLGANGSVKMGTSAPFGLGPVTSVNRLGVTTGNIAGSTSVTGLGVVVNGPFGIPSTTLTTNGLNIIGGPSVTKAGIDAGNKKITRVDAGTAGTDAVNVDQLGAAISSNKTKYYSVNSTGGTNDLNEGATGQNAMAMGRNSVATGSQAISIGSSAGGQKTTASGEQSIAMGANTVSKGASSIAIGGDDLGAASKANLTGASSTAVNGGSVNTTFKAYTGRDLVETPPYQVNTASDGAASIAMGAKALSKGALSTAIGIQSSSAGVASSAFGVGSSASEEGSVALGAGSVANVAGGVVGYVPTGASAADATAITNTQSGARYGAVSVGNGDKGGNRQIVNLAAGTNDSDAVNVAQLKGGVSSVVDLGLNFDGDTGTTVNRKLGQKLTVKGGATTPLSDNNIGVVASSPDTLTVKLAKDLTGLDSVTTGGTVMNNSGLRVGNSLVNQNGFTFLSTGSPNNTVRLTKAGLHNGNKQITGVGSGGTTLTNAANIGDVKSAAAGSRTEVVKGTNVTSVGKTTGSNGQDIYTVNADGAKVSVGSALTVSDTKDTTTNVTDYKVDLSADTKSSLSNADSALQTVITQIDGTAVKTITKGDNTANFLKGDNIVLSDDLSGGIKIATAQDLVLNSVKTGNTTVNTNGMTIVAPTLARTVILNSNGLNNGGNKIINVKAGEADTDVVNVGQLNLANTTINKGLDFGGDSGTDINRKLGEKLIVKGGDTINSDPTTKNISVTADGADTLTVRLAKDINLGNTGSVTTGNTQVNNAGITLYNGSNDQVVLTNNGLNNGNNKITNVAVGTLSAASKDAVNGSQLFETNEKVAKGIKFDLNGTTKTYALGEAIQVATDANITTTAFGNGAKFGLADTIKIGGTSANAVSINGTTGTIKGLSNTTFDADAVYDGGQAATQEQLSGLQSGINTTFNKGISFGGDSGTDVNRKLGERVIVKGGVSDPTKLTDSNIGVIANGADTLSVKLAKDLTGLNSASFGNNVMVSSTGLRAGRTLVNQNGVTFISEESPNKTVMLSSNGLNNGGNKIINVAKGEAITDAVNVGQLNEVKKSAADANKGWDLSAQGDEATATTVKPSATVDLNNTDGNIKVSKTVDSNDVSFNLNKDIAIESVKTGAVTMNGDGLTIAGGPKFTKNSIDAGGNKITNVANGLIDINSKEAINGGQLDEVISAFETSTNLLAAEAGAGLNFNADSGPVINKKAGSNPLSFKGGNNITTTSEGSSIKFDLNGNINVDSVTTGNTTVNNSGVTIKNGPSMTASGIYAGNLETAPSMTSAGINAAGTKITNVADGMAPRDAVNLAQLDAVGKRLGDNMNQLGYKIGEVEDDANAGISAAMAMSSLPQAYIAGKSLIGGGIGTYNGESAVAIGFSKLFDDGRWIMKLNGTADTQGNVGASVGAGFHFD